MGYLKINKVMYLGDSYYYESPTLNDGLNIIEGPNGTGKSTFMNLIYYGLGGDVAQFTYSKRGTQTEIIEDTNNFVQLDISIDEEGYTLKRFIGQNDLIIKEPEKDIEVFPINRSKNEKVIFSDWLLEKLGIEAFEIFQGNTNYKINAKDIFRLIYYDQDTPPIKIYKQPDVENLITDSEELRKIIFQLLIGKAFSDYYKAISEQKKLEKERAIAKSVIDEFNIIANRLKQFSDDLNLTFLKGKKTGLEEQLDKLYLAREALKINRPSSKEGNLDRVEDLKSKLILNELEANDLKKEKNNLAQEKIKLRHLKEDIILEVTQIRKIIHAHDSLSLFSMDTCPYCLRKVEREKGKCVCGQDVDEAQYERFFYDSAEYTDILKSKQKTVETINSAIESTEFDYKEVSSKIDELLESNNQIKDEISELIGQIDAGIDIDRLDEIDDKILDVRNEISQVNQQIEIEQSRDHHQKKYDKINSDLEIQKNRTQALRAEANNDILEKVEDFNEIYNRLMTNTLRDCHNAKIDYENYLPIINNGEYREASSVVPIRLNYFFTLLSMSLRKDDVKYPHFTMIDTPQTAGIDKDNLLNCLNQINELPPEDGDSSYQIILSSGLDSYPEEYKEFVFQTLSEESRLLKRKEREEELDELEPSDQES